jgi:hypothetical protein
MATNIDYGKIVNRSWVLIKKNKWLWVYGLVLAAFGGGGSGSGSGGGNGGGTSKSLKDIPEYAPSDSLEKGKEVLGAATTAISDWFTSVPLTTWLWLLLVLLILFGLGLIVGMVLNSWAKAGLIFGLDLADQEKTVTLPSTSQSAQKNILPLIKLGLIHTGIFLVLFFGGLLGAGLIAGVTVGLSFSPIAAGIIAVLLGLILGGTVLVLLILFSMVGIYADRLVVLHAYQPWMAWKKSLALTKKSFLSIVVMGIINSMVGCAVGCMGTLVSGVVLAIPGLLLLIPVFSKGIYGLTWPIGLGLGILVIIFIQINLLVRALLVVFNYSNWNLFMKQALSEEKI